MRRFCVAVTDYIYIDIPEEDLEGMSDEEACELAEEMYQNGESSDFGDPWIEVTEC